MISTRHHSGLSGMLLALGLAALPIATQAGSVLSGTLGANSRDGFTGGLFAYSVGFHVKFDEMVLLGAESGMGSVAGPSSIPILGSGMVRLPLGRVVLPLAKGEVGYLLDDDHAGLMWRGGGGFDIKNGRRSSLLFLGGYEHAPQKRGWYGRAGLLLEF